MSSIVTFQPADESFPSRSPNLSSRTPLVSVFSLDREMLPFVRYLLSEHDIFSVADFDNAPRSVFDGFKLAEPLKARFKLKVGRPLRAGRPESARVIALPHVQRADCAFAPTRS